MRVLPAVRRTQLLRSSTLFRSALANRPGPGMALAADAPTTDGSESLPTDTSGIVIPSQDRKLFQSINPGPEPHDLREIVNHA